MRKVGEDVAMKKANEKMAYGRVLAALAGALIALSALMPAGAAALEIEPGSFQVGTTTSEAGAHPDITTSFAFAKDAEGHVGGTPRNITVDLPVGFAGYVSEIPTYTPGQLSQPAFSFPFAVSCPVESQV